MKRRITLNTNITEDTVTLGQAFADFITEKRALGRVQGTLNDYEETFAYFLRHSELTPNTDVNTVSEKHIYKFINAYKDTDTKPTTINHYLRGIRTFLNWFMDKGYIEQPFKISLIKVQEESVKLFSEDELQALLEKPKKNDSFATWRTWMIVCFVLATGCRASTIINVKISDIDFGAKEIVLAHTKNKRTQIIPLSSDLAPDLKEYIKMWRTQPYSEWLFPSIEDEQMIYNTLRCSFTRYCTDRGVARHNFHGLRHSFAKGWVQNNGNMFKLQAILGHSTLAQTQKYVKLFNEDLKDGYDNYTVLGNMKKAKSRKQVVRRFE